MSMEKITFILEQHTPMLHFQPLQDDAGLRASEVKPRFDRWLVDNVWRENFHNCKRYLKGYNADKEDDWEEKFVAGYRALNYRMKIECEEDRSSSLQMKRVPTDKYTEIYGQQLRLETTGPYPHNRQSIIMSNIGGRLPDNVVNFRLYGAVKVIVWTEDSTLAGIIKERFEEFVMSVNFGNRKSKGFGSFAVSKIDNKKVDGYDVNAPWILFFNLKPRGNKGFLKEDEAYRDLFVLIGVFWRYLKKTYSGTKQKKSVLLGRHLKAGLPDLNTAPRIPSPIIFKPIIIEKNPACWQMAIQLLYDKDIIAKACVSGTTKEYDRYIMDVDLGSIKSTSQKFLINKLMDLSKLSNEELD